MRTTASNKRGHWRDTESWRKEWSAKKIGTLKISYHSVNGETVFGVFGCFPSIEEKRGKIWEEKENNFARKKRSENEKLIIQHFRKIIFRIWRFPITHNPIASHTRIFHLKNILALFYGHVTKHVCEITLGVRQRVLFTWLRHQWGKRVSLSNFATRWNFAGPPKTTSSGRGNTLNDVVNKLTAAPRSLHSPQRKDQMSEMIIQNFWIGPERHGFRVQISAK